MTSLQQSFKRTVAAIAVSLPHQFGCLRQPTLQAVSSGVNTLSMLVSPSPHNFNSVQGTRESQRLFSSFTAPEPPQSKGMNVFQDIDFSVAGHEGSQSSLRNTDPGAVFVVTGASRGIGLQFVKTLLDTTQGTIVACCRSPDTANGLHSFLSSLDDVKRNRIQVVPLDVENQDSIEQAAAKIRTTTERVDMLLNVAGILGDGKSVPGPERSVTKLERDWMEKTFQVNVIGPVMFSKELAPLMSQTRRRASKEDDLSQSKARPVAVIANLSARVGSISDNGLGGWYSYRMSKAALNQATRTLANELKRQSVWCVALHPGTTDTDLSKPFQKNVEEGRLFPVEFTVESLLKVIDSMEAENSGGLYDWAGKAIPF
jgi:NAD(P)-dependent dehydrogenase (short-subunit alcohol dehydrogenase family)